MTHGVAAQKLAINQTNLHYINCGNQFVDATGDGINQVQNQFSLHEWAMHMLTVIHAMLTAWQKHADMLHLMPALYLGLLLLI